MAIDVESDENEIDQLVQSSTCSTTNAFDNEHSDNNSNNCQQITAIRIKDLKQISDELSISVHSERCFPKWD